MYLYLEKKQWGYQTICPDEENTVGLYQIKYKNNDRYLNVWMEPSFLSYTYKKEINTKQEIWKHEMLGAQFNSYKSKEEINDLFGFIYDFLDEDGNVIVTLSENANIWGWGSIINDGVTWIRIHEHKNLWMPCK